MRLVAVVSLLAVTLGVGAAPPHDAGATDLTTWDAKVVFIADGDTFDAVIDDTGETKRVRMASIQAMELDDYAKKVGDCHAPEADRRLGQLIDGRRVRLVSENPDRVSARRIMRYTDLDRSGELLDVGGVLVREGHALWSPMPEGHRNRAYAQAQAEARRDGRNLWNPTFCGAGPQQAIGIKMWLNYDADGTDRTNLNGEWVKIRNLHKTATLRLGGWKMRDAALRWYRFPAGTVVKPGKVLTVHVGSGTNTATRRYWRQTKPMFQNPSATGHYTGDGAYLFDPDGDIRQSFLYPCQLRCVDRANGKIVIRRVNWDAPGDDQANVNGEWVLIKNVSTRSFNLENYLVESLPHIHHLRGRLHPGAQIRLHVGRGTNTASTRYWGKPGPIFNNRGGAVAIRRYDGVRVACRSWGTGRC